MLKRSNENEGEYYMKSVQVSLNTIDRVKNFVNVVSKFDYKFELMSEKGMVNAKSIIGIFSLDLTKPISMNIHAGEKVDQVMDALAYYII